MLTKNATPAVLNVLWGIDPLEVIHSSWGTITAMNDERARLHLGGRITLRNQTVVELELWPVLYEKDQRMTFIDGDEILFLLPFDVSEGIEGAYLKLIEVLGELR